MALERKQIEFNDMFERKNFDITTFISVLLLVGAGFLAIYSATHTANMNNRFGSQLLFAAGGIGGMIVMALIPVRWFQAVAYPLYAISLALLVFVAFKGKVVYGHRSWIGIGTFQFQPSEIAKLATIFTVGAFLNKGRDLGELVNVIIVCLIVIVPVALILKEPDPGTAVIFIGLLVVVLLWSGVDLFLLAAIVLPATVAVL
jgi:rod shape determining protein RodA